MRLPGWEHLGGAVWEHSSGVRIHVHGLAQLPSGELVVGTQWPESQRLAHFRRVYANNKRGTMAWSLSVAADPN